MHVKNLYDSCIYNRLPEDEPSASKHVEDVINYIISLEKMHFIGLYCIIVLIRCYIWNCPLYKVGK